MFKYLLICCFLSCSLMRGESGSTLLNGEWKFAPDYGDVGEAAGWYTADNKIDAGWDRVTVPHCWSIDPRYPNYVGAAWYRRTFTVSNTTPEDHWELSFGAVFYKAKIWLNGTLIGQHEGGYTGFSLDVTKALLPGQPNILVVKADNRWSTETIPGARVGTRVSDLVYPWWDYGGIIRDVQLVVTPPVFIRNVRIIADPNLGSHTASVSVTAFVANTGTVAARAGIQGSIEQDRQAVASIQIPEQEIPPGQIVEFQTQIPIPAAKLVLWQLDRPALYNVSLSTTGSTIMNVQRTFGIRKIEARNAQLLLNGNPIRLGGANRVVDDPQYASLEPPSVVDRDLHQMKEAGMELMRMAHYPLSPVVLDWADRHGLLLIEEAGNWGLPEQQLDSPVIRTKLQVMAKEMIQRDWNHPSIIGWSVGNEYASNLPAGLRWTRDMRQYFRSIDSTRLITFADNHFWSGNVHRGEDDGSFYSDLVGINPYGSVSSVAQRLDLIHKLYPEKPVLLTEWGIRNDQVKNEADRQRYAEQVIAEIRKRPWIVGASLWTYNDYRSRFPGTAANGLRPWGAVHYDRTPYPLYETLRNEFSPVIVSGILEENGKSIVICRARPDFPSKDISGYRVLLGNDESRPIPDLHPGAEARIVFNTPAKGKTVAIERPGGFRSFLSDSAALEHIQ